MICKYNSELVCFVEVSSPGILLEFRIDVFNLSYDEEKLYLADGRVLMNAALNFLPSNKTRMTLCEPRSSCNL